MQRYRINHRLIITLFVGSLVLAVTLYLLWWWQVDRKAGHLQQLATKTAAEGDYLQAFRYQNDYVSLRPQEDEARIELAKFALEVLEDPEATIESQRKAFSTLDNTVRRTGDPGLKRELAKLTITGQPDKALVHVEDLLIENPNDPELNEMRVRALFRSKSYRKASALAAKLVGYDKKTGEFSDDKVIIGDQPDIYALLAEALYRQTREREAARKIIDRMVEMNPDSANAHLKQASLLARLGEQEKADEALEKAYQLDPKDPEVLSQKGMQALRNEEFDKAIDIFQTAIKEHPDIAYFRQLHAQAEFARENVDKAIAIVDEGIRDLGKQKSVMLMRYKIDLLFSKNNFDEIEEVLDVMTAMNNPQLTPVIDFVRARMKLVQGDVQAASRELQRVRPMLIDEPRLKAQAGALLAGTYEQLGMQDLARQTYKIVLNDDPNNKLAQIGLQRIERRINPTENQQSSGLNKLVREMLALPEEQQDWRQVDRVVEEFAEKSELSELRTTLIRFRILLQRKKYDEAERMLKVAKALEPENLEVRYGAIDLAANDPDKGPDMALQMLDELVDVEGSSLRSRIQRARLLLAQDLNSEELVDRLIALTDGIQEWNPREQATLCEMLANQFLQLKQMNEASQMLQKAIEIAPESLPLRLKAFEVALQRQDEQAMDEAQEIILDYVKSKDDPAYVLAQVKRKIAAFGKKKISREELAKSRKMLDKALEIRPQWHELHNLYGRLLAILTEDLDLAIEHFEDGLEYGPADTQSVITLIKLLERSGQNASALEKIELIPKGLRERALGNLEAIVLWKLGKKKEALEAAESLAKLQSENAATQVWYANFAQQAGDQEAAIKAIRHALEIEPSEPGYWTLLADFYMKANEKEKVVKTLAEARLAVDTGIIPLLDAKQYEIRGLLPNAEDIYLAVYAGRLDELVVNRELASFYMRWASVDPTKMERAFPYVNHILKEAYEGRAEVDNPHVTWARRQAVRYLISTGDYRKALQAQELVEAGAQDGKLSIEDQQLMAQVLASRRDPVSQRKAISLLKKLNKQGQLEKQQLLTLVQLIGKTEDWEKAESLITEALPVYRNDPDFAVAFINVLIDRGEFAQAASRLKRLRDLDTKSTTYIELRTRLAAERDSQAELRRILQSLAPPLGGALNAQQLQRLLYVARLASRHGDYEFAEKLFRFYTKRNPAGLPELTSFLAMHGDSEEAVQLIQQQFKDNPDDMLTLMNRMLRSRRLEVGDRYDEIAEKMVNSALRDDADSIQRQMIRAELLEIQQKVDASIAAYEKILKRGDLPDMLRASVMNNIGFLLALQGERLDEASSLIEQAMTILGPIEDMLDTRALVRIARQEYDLAVKDMKLATSVSQDPMKYYHLAQAQLLAGNEQEALDAWKQAQKLGFEAGKLYLLEREQYEQIKSKLEKLEAGSTS